MWFVVIGVAIIVMNLAKEKAPVKAVAAFMQKDMQVLLAHPDSGINSIADMKGHPILLSDASVTAFWVWLRSKYGFTDSQVRKYTESPWRPVSVSPLGSAPISRSRARPLAGSHPRCGMRARGNEAKDVQA